MVNGLNTNDSILNNKSVTQQQELAKVSNSIAKNPYAKQNLLVDQSDISSTAINMYQKDQDISKFKGLVLNGTNTEEEISKISQFVSNDDLSSAMLKDSEFLNGLF
jgi:hypothetical protein